MSAGPDTPAPLGPERIAYRGKIIEVVEQTMAVGGREIVYESARRAPGARLIIVSPEPAILLTREYRAELQAWDYRLPGGKVFDTLAEYRAHLAAGADLAHRAADAAYREAVEEAGIAPHGLTLYRVSTCGATVTWDLYYFVVRAFSPVAAGQRLEPGEHIEPVWVTPDQAWELCLSGKMQEDRSVAVLLQFLHAR